MAQNINSGSIVLGRFVWELDGHHIYICRQFRISPRPAGSTTLEAAVLLDHQFGPFFCSVVAAAWEYLGCWCRCQSPAWDESPDEMAFDGPYDPWGSDDPLPGQVAGLLTLKTNRPRPARTGRIFLPPADETANDNGQPSAAYLDAMQLVADWLPLTHQEVLPGFGSPLGATAAVWKSGNSALSVVTGVTVHTRWATQRRRSGTAGSVGFPTEPSPGVE